jgi:hypothetical protein
VRNSALPPGQYVAVSSRFVRAGDVVRLGSEDHVVIRKRFHDSCKYMIVTESMKTGNHRQGYFLKDQKIWRFKIQSSLPSRWEMASGDVVLYPAEKMVAVRHGTGWYTSAGRRSLQPDAWILQDVMSGRAKVVRNAEIRHAVHMRRPYLTGSVAAVYDVTAPEPTAWICVEPDLWCSTTKVEASDLMIEMELNRNRYVLLYVPSERGKDDKQR